MWQQMQPPSRPHYISDSDLCFYCREYQSRGGFQASDTNQLISNFKKSPRFRNSNSWYFKGKAIEKCVDELSQLFGQDGHYLLVPIPTSKTEDDPEYDNRIVLTLQKLAGRHQGITVEEPLAFASSHESQHHRDNRMSPDEVYAQLRWQGFKCPSHTGTVILFDDVITTGSHYVACKKLISEQTNLNVCGVFWAKTVWKDCELSEFDS